MSRTQTSAKTKAARTAPPTASQSAEIDRLKAELAAAHQQLATRNVPPVALRQGMIDSGDDASVQNGDVLMPSVGNPTLEHPTIQVPDGPVSKSKLEELAFMEELVTVLVHESDHKYAAPCISVWNFGRHQLFVRGQEITCKRKFLEVLARSKPVTYGSVEYIDAEGNRAIKYPKRTANRYAFTVVRDDNPNGRAWLKKILQQA